jgi:monoamine oxidase
MNSVDTVIVGAGLSGLDAAWLLEKSGQRDYVVLEARPEVGGRVRSIAPGDPSSTLDRFDLGATWFWPDMQPYVWPLLRELGLEAFAQDDTGDMLIERSPLQSPMRVPGQVALPPAWRVMGGMVSLVDALRQRLPGGHLLTEMTVTAIKRTVAGIQIEAVDEQGQTRIWHADRALLALPPRLVINRIAFEPALPAELERSWARTTTHMAPHAKYLACYDSAFWKEQGLSGQARSMTGPLGEIHDASQPGFPALFGFLLIPAEQRKRIAPLALLAHCRAQLVRLFGPQAQTPRMEALQDWASEPFTATAECGLLPPSHLATPPLGPSEGPWAGRLVGAGSEWSPDYPGYVAGALDAPVRALRWLREQAPLADTTRESAGIASSSNRNHSP